MMMLQERFQKTFIFKMKLLKRMIFTTKKPEKSCFAMTPKLFSHLILRYS